MSVSDDMPRPSLEARLVAWVQAETWAESRRLLEADPELLSAHAEATLARMVAEAAAPEDVELLADHLRLLRRCRASGLDAAFRELDTSPQALLDLLARALDEEPAVRRALEEASRRAAAADPILGAVLELLDCDQPAAVFDLAARRPEILDDEADARLAALADDARALGSSAADAMADLIAERHATLRQVRQLMRETGLSADQVAHAAHVVQALPTLDEATAALVGQLEEFLNTPDWAAARAYVAVHPELLSPAADLVLTSLIAGAEQIGDRDAVRILDTHRNRLTRARTEGLDAIGPISPPAEAQDPTVTAHR